MTPSQVELLSSLGTVREFADGEAIVARTDGAFPLYVIVEGQVEVQGLFGEVVNVLSGGALIGEVAFIDRHARTADAVSKGHSKAIELPEDILAELQTSHPDIAALMLTNLTRALCKKIRTAQRFIDVQDIGRPE